MPTPSDRTPDALAAHEFLTELRTRITTQPLPYQYGVEARALESLWEIFGQARAVLKKYAVSPDFAAEVTRMLNVDLRPVTAKWHRAHAEGRLDSKDGSDEFRIDLEAVRKKLLVFAAFLQKTAYGTATPDAETPPALLLRDLDECFESVAFGVPAGTRGLPPEIIADINHDEALEVAARRANCGSKAAPGKNAVGLAFSGGGIRSATFCLGVTQVLAERGLLKDADFLSTVSGGGYTGSFLTTRLGTGTPHSDVAAPHGPDPAPIRYVRHHAKFLNPANLKDGWSMATGVLAGMLLNWTVPLLVIVVCALVAVVFKGQVPASFWRYTTLGAAGLTTLALVAYAGLLNGSRKQVSAGGWLLGLTAGLTAMAGACWLIDLGYAAFNHQWPLFGPQSKRLGVAGAISAAIAAAPVIARYLPLLKKPFAQKIALQVGLVLAGLIIPLLAVLLFYFCRQVGELTHGWLFLGALAIALALVAVFLLNINLTAPHRLYRDRLAKTFIATRGSAVTPVPLQSLNPQQLAPYHLVNTTLNLPSSEEPALRDRKCAFFLFSKHWIGSATTGYHRTADWNANGHPADLATAMAVSGAAASSHMGLGSMPTLTALLTVLNVRLGFWIRQPNHTVLSEAPGFLCLLRELASVGMDEKSTWLNLSDGGHIENMGAYELLRRRCKFIVCVDGEADPEFTFGGLMTLVRHAQIDLGIRLDTRVTPLRADPKTGLSQTHVMLCRIYYPEAGGQPAALGLFLYLKLSVTGNEPDLIAKYRSEHAEFPHQSTADQFFDEAQFEAYRQLGVHVAEGLFSPALVPAGKPPATTAEWFRHLAANLLEPA